MWWPQRHVCFPGHCRPGQEGHEGPFLCRGCRSNPKREPPIEMAPRTIAGVNCNVKAGHGQVEGDVPIAARVHVSGAHGEKDAPCRGVFWQRHLEEEEALVSTGSSRVHCPHCPGAGQQGWEKAWSWLGQPWLE